MEGERDNGLTSDRFNIQRFTHLNTLNWKNGVVVFFSTCQTQSTVLPVSRSTFTCVCWFYHMVYVLFLHMQTFIKLTRADYSHLISSPKPAKCEQSLISPTFSMRTMGWTIWEANCLVISGGQFELHVSSTDTVCVRTGGTSRLNQPTGTHCKMYTWLTNDDFYLFNDPFDLQKGECQLGKSGMSNESKTKLPRIFLFYWNILPN